MGLTLYQKTKPIEKQKEMSNETKNEVKQTMTNFGLISSYEAELTQGVRVIDDSKYKNQDDLSLERGKSNFNENCG